MFQLRFRRVYSVNFQPAIIEKHKVKYYRSGSQLRIMAMKDMKKNMKERKFLMKESKSNEIPLTKAVVLTVSLIIK